MEVQDGIYYLTGIVCDENLQRMLGLANDISGINRNRPSGVGPSVAHSGGHGIGAPVMPSLALGQSGPPTMVPQAGPGRKANSARAKDLTKNKSDKTDHMNQPSGNSSKDKPHVCNVCGRSFTAKSGLLLHKRIHEDDRPFSCRICGKSFTQVGHLNTHKRMHTTDKFYSCDVCYKQFETRGNLKAHKMVHVEEHYGLYKCEVCGERFTYSGNLRKHLADHDVEKRHYCDFCGKQFTQAGHLESHVLDVHTGGKKPYKCGLCGKEFTFMQSLQNHSSMHV